MDTSGYFAEKARQCRRLVRVTNDERVIQGLSAMAEEFDAKAHAERAKSRTVDLLGNGKAGHLVPDDGGEVA